MKTTMKKLGALALVLVMLLALGTTAFASAPELEDGEQGVFAAKDTPASQSKTLVLKKEIRVYNVDEATVKAPTISYTYSIAPATVASGTTVTDSDNGGTVHETGVSVMVPVKAGVGSPTIADPVAWTASENVSAGTDGAVNTKGISIDFSNIVFTGAGVYRYVITEALTSGYTYNTSGVTETTAPDNPTDNKHTRYVDVYVRPASGYDTGDDPTDWDIYGYTCFLNNVSITASDKRTTAVKTNGFVDGTSDGSTEFLADQYYTFNVTISKTVVGDGYGAATVDFPFTVLFTNGTVSAGTIVTNGATAPTGTDFTHNTSVDLTTRDLKGVATLKSGQQIKYVGIPNGTAVEVYETNVATGVTYTVSTLVDNDTEHPIVDNSVSWGAAPQNAVAQVSPKPAYQSTKATFSTTADVDDDIAHTVAVTNTLLTISPTSLVLRYGPFALILALGVVILLVSRRRREEEN